MKNLVFLAVCAATLAGCQTVVKTEPGRGQLSYGAKVLVDDGSCPTGQMKEVTGGNGQGIPRKYACVPAPKA